MDMEQITDEQFAQRWEARRQEMLANHVGLVLYDPATDRSIVMAFTPEDFSKLPSKMQWEAYLLPALQQLELAK